LCSLQALLLQKWAITSRRIVLFRGGSILLLQNPLTLYRNTLPGEQIQIHFEAWNLNDLYYSQETIHHICTPIPEAKVRNIETKISLKSLVPYTLQNY
jgi:hypothetical protein